MMRGLLQRLVMREEQSVTQIRAFHPQRTGNWLFDSLFGLDYMGDSNLEGDEVLRVILFARGLDLTVTDEEVEFNGVKRRAWFLAPGSARVQATDDWWREMYFDDYFDDLFRVGPRPARPLVRLDRLAWLVVDEQAPLFWTFNIEVMMNLRHALGQVDLVRR